MLVRIQVCTSWDERVGATQLHCGGGGGLFWRYIDASFGGIDAETSAAGKSGHPQGIPRHQTRRVVKKRRPLYVPNTSTPICSPGRGGGGGGPLMSMPGLPSPLFRAHSFMGLIN